LCVLLNCSNEGTNQFQPCDGIDVFDIKISWNWNTSAYGDYSDVLFIQYLFGEEVGVEGGLIGYHTTIN
jgi:hypothetical protein